MVNMFRPWRNWRRPCSSAFHKKCSQQPKPGRNAPNRFDIGDIRLALFVPLQWPWCVLAASVDALLSAPPPVVLRRVIAESSTSLLSIQVAGCARLLLDPAAIWRFSHPQVDPQRRTCSNLATTVGDSDVPSADLACGHGTQSAAWPVDAIQLRKHPGGVFAARLDGCQPACRLRVKILALSRRQTLASLDGQW